jgi:methylase of polypeptide subunit release factors
MPFQYLLSSAHWHTYVLAVGPGVLIPRPETEIFARLVAEALAARPWLAAAPWADLGTGSGAVAIAAADQLRKVDKVRGWRRAHAAAVGMQVVSGRRRPRRWVEAAAAAAFCGRRPRPPAQSGEWCHCSAWQVAVVWAVDVSPTAVDYARFNAQLVFGSDARAPAAPPTAVPPSSPPRSGPGAAPSILTEAEAASGERPVRAVLGSWFEPLRSAGLAGRLGGVLSNPPYIPRVQMEGLQVSA